MSDDSDGEDAYRVERNEFSLFCSDWQTAGATANVWGEGSEGCFSYSIDLRAYTQELMQVVEEKHSLDGFSRQHRISAGIATRSFRDTALLGSAQRSMFHCDPQGTLLFMVVGGIIEVDLPSTESSFADRSCRIRLHRYGDELLKVMLAMGELADGFRMCGDTMVILNQAMDGLVFLDLSGSNAGRLQCGIVPQDPLVSVLSNTHQYGASYRACFHPLLKEPYDIACDVNRSLWLVTAEDLAVVIPTHKEDEILIERPNVFSMAEYGRGMNKSWMEVLPTGVACNDRGMFYVVSDDEPVVYCILIDDPVPGEPVGSQLLHTLDCSPHVGASGSIWYVNIDEYSDEVYVTSQKLLLRFSDTGTFLGSVPTGGDPGALVVSRRVAAVTEQEQVRLDCYIWGHWSPMCHHVLPKRLCAIAECILHLTVTRECERTLHTLPRELLYDIIRISLDFGSIAETG